MPTRLRRCGAACHTDGAPLPAWRDPLKGRTFKAETGPPRPTGYAPGHPLASSLTRPGYTDHRPGHGRLPRASLGPLTHEVPEYRIQPFVRTLEHFTILPSPGSQAGEPSGEEPPGVWGSLDGHMPWETALREPSRLVQTCSRPTSHRGGHWFDPSIAHRCKARSETH
jgi:hypothetical protein